MRLLTASNAAVVLIASPALGRRSPPKPPGPCALRAQATRPEFNKSRNNPARNRRLQRQANRPAGSIESAAPTSTHGRLARQLPREADAHNGQRLRRGARNAATYRSTPTSIASGLTTRHPYRAVSIDVGRSAQGGTVVRLAGTTADSSSASPARTGAGISAAPTRISANAARRTLGRGRP